MSGLAEFEETWWMANGHVTPAGTSVLHEPKLDPTFIVKARMAIRHDIEIRIGARHEGVGRLKVLEAA